MRNGCFETRRVPFVPLFRQDKQHKTAMTCNNEGVSRTKTKEKTFQTIGSVLHLVASVIVCQFLRLSQLLLDIVIVLLDAFYRSQVVTIAKPIESYQGYYIDPIGQGSFLL